MSEPRKPARSPNAAETAALAVTKACHHARMFEPTQAHVMTDERIETLKRRLAEGAPICWRDTDDHLIQLHEVIIDDDEPMATVKGTGGCVALYAACPEDFFITLSVSLF